jgi:hypothetical protein
MSGERAGGAVFFVLMPSHCNENREHSAESTSNRAEERKINSIAD